ncbi:hypothetical protein [Tsukamurella columbiensis]|uniref:Uncharacterized protein n=1 Tax=Tsukamurella columbiensis TaxID=128509 RepID=A0ABX1LK95_9ACTN|nr:hypothetical protein [Tsukamurella columbiensis]NMD58020.1 hypothetical protein [Tsukamurella columbiensis]
MSTANTETPRTDAPMSGRESVLTLLALACGGLSSLLIVAATTGSGLASMQVLFWAVDVPAMAIVAVIGLLARRGGLDRLARRLWVGLLGGVVLTMALDVVRVAGVHLGYLPDSIAMFANLITGTNPMAHPGPGAYALGEVYHYLNGISFALVYSIAFGRTRWWGPVAFSVLVPWIGMMLLPPMAPMLGVFGTHNYASAWNPYAADTLLAHIAMGLALAAVIHGLARDRGVLLAPHTLPGLHHLPAHAHPAT